MKKIKISWKVNIMVAIFMAVLFIVRCTTRVTNQPDFWESPSAYLGQKPPGDIPEIFAAQILADSGLVLGRVAFSTDGKEFYYGFARHWFDFNGTGVKQIIYDGKNWSRPGVLTKNLSNPTLSPDGRKLFFGGQNSEVWLSERITNGWSTPVRWLDKKYGLYNFQPTQHGPYYVGSNANTGSKNDYSTYDFCTLTISKTDTLINSLGMPLNTPAFDGDSYVAPDESYMIISAKETSTYECELYISFRKADRTWTNPKSLGTAINDGLAHRFGQYVSPDGKYLFYTKGTGEKDCHFYWVRFDALLKKLNHSNFYPYVKTPLTDKHIAIATPFQLIIPPGTFLDDDGTNTLSYSVALANKTALPPWLIFDATKNLLFGTAPVKGTFLIDVIATDTQQATASSVFTLTVN